MKKFNLSKKTSKIIVIACIIVIALIVALVLTNKYSFAQTKEKKFESLVIDYYENRIKGKVIGIDKQVVTLLTLKNANYDITKFQKEGCKLESYAHIILKDAYETDVSKIEYTIESHLDCSK